MKEGDKTVCCKQYLKRIFPAKRAGLFIILLGLLFLASCSKKPASQKPAVPVLTVTVEKKTVPIEIKNFGVVEAYSTVSVKSQITGVLMDVNFTEGQMVQKDALLLTIDSRPSMAVLKAAQANLNKDEVQLANAEKELARQQDLLKKGFTSQEKYDQTVTAADTFRAAIEADKAALDNAKLQFGYCYIHSPVDGIAGMLLVNKGNLVKLNDVTVVTINQIKPIYVTFSVPQQYLSRIQKYMAAGKLDVAASFPQSSEKPAAGWLSFIDNSVDNNTGTIRLKATFENQDSQLWPGQYVNVSLILAQEPNVIVVPSQAIQTGQAGQFVYVVKADDTVEHKAVTVERRLNSESVVTGIEAGEIVVTDGQLNLVPGAKIQIKNSARGEQVESIKK